MFSRAAKSIVQSLNQRSYHVTKGNFKAAVGSTGEVGNYKAQFSRQPRLDSSGAQEIMPFKNLKFKNITPNSAERQTLPGVGARAVEATAAEGNVQAIDLVQLRGLGSIISNVNGTPGFYKTEGLRLGSSDCGVPPIRRKKNPCDPPEGPCKPLPPPGYPSKPKPERKPFCVKCPPKKPCPENNC